MNTLLCIISCYPGRRLLGVFSGFSGMLHPGRLHRGNLRHGSGRLRPLRLRIHIPRLTEGFPSADVCAVARA